MKYETQWDKKSTRTYDKVAKKFVISYEARYEASDFDGLKTAAEAALGDKYMSFEVRDEATRQVTSIEYTDQPTPEETTAVNAQLDVVFTTFMQESGMTPWA